MGAGSLRKRSQEKALQPRGEKGRYFKKSQAIIRLGWRGGGGKRRVFPYAKRGE